MFYVNYEQAKKDHPIRAKIADIITYPVEGIRYKMARNRARYKDPTNDWEEYREEGWRNWQRSWQYTWQLGRSNPEYVVELCESSSVWGQVFLMTNPIFVACLAALGLILTVPPLRDLAGAILAPIWDAISAAID